MLGRQKIQKFIGLAIVMIVFSGVYFYFTQRQLFDTYYDVENGFLEWLNITGLGLSCFICFYRMRILSPFRERTFINSLGVQGILFLLVFILEILDSSSLLTFIFNTLGLSHQGTKIFLAIVMLIYFFAMPFSYMKNAQFKKTMDALAIALPTIWHGVFWLLIFSSLTYFIHNKNLELLEFSGIWIIVMFLLQPLNREVFSRKVLTR